MNLHEKVIAELQKTHEVIMGEPAAKHNGRAYVTVRFDSFDVAEISNFIKKYSFSESQVVLRGPLHLRGCNGGESPYVRFLADNVMTAFWDEGTESEGAIFVLAHLAEGYSPKWELVKLLGSANDPYLDTTLDRIVFPGKEMLADGVNPDELKV